MKKLLVILAMTLLGATNVFSQEQTKTLYDVYLEMGNDAYENGNYESAINWITKASEYAKNKFGEEHPYYSGALNIIAYCYAELENFAKAIEINVIALLNRQKYFGETHPAYAQTLHNLASCYYRIGDLNNAIKLQEQSVALELQINGDKHPSYATSLNNLSTCYYAIGNYSKAIELQNDVLSIRKELLGENHLDYASSLNNLSVYYNTIGDINKAISLQEQAITIYKNEEGENSLGYATSLNNLANNFYALGNYEYAIKLNEQALQIKKRILGDNNLEYSQSLNNLAVCYLESKNITRAIELHKKALDIRKTILGVSNPIYANSLNNLAICYNNLNDLEISLFYLKQSLQIRGNTYGENHPYYINTLSDIALTYFEKNSLEPIPLLWYRILNSIKQNSILQLKNFTSRSRTYYWISNIQQTIVIPNNLFAKVLSNDNLSMGLSYNSLLFSKGVILASDIEFDKVIRESGDTVLLEKFEELRTTRSILNTYYNKPITERPEGEVERLEARAEVLEKDLLAGSKEYADFTRRLEIEWQDVQAALGDKDVAIEILAADEHIDEDTPPYYAALVLRKGWDAPKFVELCGAEELQTYFDSDNGLAMMYREANSRKLYDLIWGKLAEHINEGDNVYFSPGGLLHQVNVELLQDTDGRLANEKYNLHRVSSTRELCFETPKIAHSEAVLYGGLRYDLDSTTMIAQSRAVRPEEEHYAMRGLQLDSLRGKLNYLSASKTEVEKISKQMNQHGIKTTLYVEQVGNEESFKALSGKKTPIIHLATHGFFFKNEEAKVKPFFRMMSMDQERPRPDNSLRRSGLAFAGAQKAWDGEEIPKGIDDGVMLAQEIASMDLAGTDLVVLSACETGLGEINSEGVFGLQRAFKKAGVQTLIMSLWKVHDEATALFMQTFYENLLSGKSKRDSFAAAQMALREHRDYGKDPAYWAAFVMLD